jgi:hypothetical protein
MVLGVAGTKPSLHEWGTYCQPLRVVNLARAEQSVQRVVAGDDEAGNVDEELSSDVEEDEEEVEAGETEDYVDLGDGGLLLKVVEGGVLGQLEHDIVSALCIVLDFSWLSLKTFSFIVF